MGDTDIGYVKFEKSYFRKLLSEILISKYCVYILQGGGEALMQPFRMETGNWDILFFGNLELPLIFSLSYILDLDKIKQFMVNLEKYSFY